MDNTGNHKDLRGREKKRRRKEGARETAENRTANKPAPIGKNKLIKKQPKKIKDNLNNYNTRKMYEVPKKLIDASYMEEKPKKNQFTDEEL